jgi:hypothetical protein
LGIEINFKDNELVNLTRAWQACGSPAESRPNDFLASVKTKQFINALVEKLNAGNSGNLYSAENITQTVRGRFGGTYAHWQIFLAYAKYLSPDFHMWANQVVKERFEEMVNPDLIIAAVPPTAFGIRWIGI